MRSKVGSIKEQRRYPRRELFIPVFYKVPNQPRFSDWVLTKDVSEHGMRLVADNQLKKGTRVKLEIDIPGRLFLLLADGKIMWTREVQKRGDRRLKKRIEAGVKVDITSPLEAKLWSKFLKKRVSIALDELIGQLENENI